MLTLPCSCCLKVHPAGPLVLEVQRYRIKLIISTMFLLFPFLTYSIPSIRKSCWILKCKAQVLQTYIRKVGDLLATPKAYTLSFTLGLLEPTKRGDTVPLFVIGCQTAPVVSWLSWAPNTGHLVCDIFWHVPVMGGGSQAPVNCSRSPGWPSASNP